MKQLVCLLLILSGCSQEGGEPKNLGKWGSDIDGVVTVNMNVAVKDAVSGAAIDAATVSICLKEDHQELLNYSDTTTTSADGHFEVHAKVGCWGWPDKLQDGNVGVVANCGALEILVEKEGYLSSRQAIGPLNEIPLVGNGEIDLPDMNILLSKTSK